MKLSSIDSRSLGRVTLDVRNFLKAHPALVHDIAGVSLAHILYSHTRLPKMSRLSRRQLRKIRNRRRRWFVDNIIMHHKRIHDMNREMTIEKAKQRILNRKDFNKNRKKQFLKKKRDERTRNTTWQETILLQERSREIRGRIDTKRIRARSKWVSIVENG